MFSAFLFYVLFYHHPMSSFIMVLVHVHTPSNSKLEQIPLIRFAGQQVPWSSLERLSATYRLCTLYHTFGPPSFFTTFTPKTLTNLVSDEMTELVTDDETDILVDSHTRV